MRKAHVGDVLARILGLSLLFAGAEALGHDNRYAIVPVERTDGVTTEHAQVFYDAVVESLGIVPGIVVDERAHLSLLLKERDLLALMAPEISDRAYAGLADQAVADIVVVPGISRIGSDYYLSLRQIARDHGNTVACHVRTTRAVSDFRTQARLLVADHFAFVPSVDEGTKVADAPVLLTEQLRDQCRHHRCEDLFPGMWGRIEQLRSRSPSEVSSVQLSRYYVYLLTLCAAATNPPEGMVFVPGGWVFVHTARAVHRTWVEPFFMDQFEVSVGEYSQFLGEERAPAERTSALLPITAGDSRFNRADLPITGITWHAAQAYAISLDKTLPTRNQWLRAAQTGVDAARAKGSQSERSRDTHIQLLPTRASGLDQTPAGIHGLQGNVREWTSTWDTDDYFNSQSPISVEPAEGTLKIIMGDSWRRKPHTRVSPFATHAKPGEAFDDVGFRCIRVFCLSPNNSVAIPLERTVLHRDPRRTQR